MHYNEGKDPGGCMKRAIKVLLLIVLFLTACNINLFAQQKLAIKVWSFTVDPQSMEKIRTDLLDPYTKLHPGVSIIWENVPYKIFRDTILSAAAVKELPDVIIDASNTIGHYSTAGYIIPLDRYVSAWKTWPDFLETPKKQAVYGGKTWGIPSRIKLNAPLLNIKLCRAAGLDPNNPPRTWAELAGWARKISQVENGKMIIQGFSGLSDGSTRIRAFELMLQQNGSRLLNDDQTAPAFNNARGIQTLNSLIELYRISEPPGVSVLAGDPLKNYSLGLVGIVPFDGFNAIAQALKANNHDILRNTRLGVPLDSGYAGGRQLVMIDGDSMMISRDAKNPDACFEFIKFLYEPDNHLLYTASNSIIPLLKSAYDSEYVRRTPFFRELLDVDKYGWVLANSPEYREARERLLIEIDKAIFGKQSSTEALGLGEELWKKAIQNSRTGDS